MILTTNRHPSQANIKSAFNYMQTEGQTLFFKVFCAFEKYANFCFIYQSSEVLRERFWSVLWNNYWYMFTCNSCFTKRVCFNFYEFHIFLTTKNLIPGNSLRMDQHSWHMQYSTQKTLSWSIIGAGKYSFIKLFI